jgi:hypothetical protein
LIAEKLAAPPTLALRHFTMLTSVHVMPGLGQVFLPQSEPDTHLHPLHVSSFPYSSLMGSEGWCVVASSLPLWKNRRNVRIAYEPVDLPPPVETLDELDEDELSRYHAVSFADECRWQEDPRPPNTEEGDDPAVAHPDPEGQVVVTKSWIRGVNKLAYNASNGTCMSWRGKSWMMLLTASWEIIGMSTPFLSNRSRKGPKPGEESGGPVPDGQPEWLITYFGASYFTPSGIDVSRRSGGMLSLLVGRS